MKPIHPDLLKSLSILCFYILLSGAYPALAQNVDLSYWFPQVHLSFDPVSDDFSIDLDELGYETDQNVSIKQNKGIRQNYASFGEKAYTPFQVPLALDTAFTIELWLKFPPKVGIGQTIMRTVNSSLQIYIGSDGQYRPLISFRTLAGGKNDSFIIPLTGNGIYSLGYYFDNDWHHFVFKYNAKTGEKEIWVDNQSPEGFRKKVEPVPSVCKAGENCIEKFRMSDFAVRGAQFKGDMDELMIYNRFVPSSVHKDHYTQVKTNSAFTYKQRSRQFLERTEEDEFGSRKSIDPQEFAPNHPNVKVMPIAQIQAFPSPRYKADHKLLPLYNWITPGFFGGIKIEGITRKMAAENYSKLQEEMARYWNYSLVLYNSRSIVQDSTFDISESIAKQSIALANKYPNIPFAVTIFWVQSVRKLQDGTIRFSNVRRKDLPDRYYFKDDQNNYVDLLGRTTSRPATISPAADTDLFVEDGKVQKDYINTILSNLTPGRKIYMINENGEVSFHHFSEGVLERSKATRADKKRLKIQDWETYQARKKTIHRAAYRDAFLKEIPALSNTHFSWYRVSGERQQRSFAWKESRKIGTLINGQYYSTVNFYIVKPSIWYGGSGPWNGWKDITEARNVEIPLGDTLFSPFVSPGWGIDPETNTRPSQWLGLLKCLSVVGAEFFYVGVFAEGKGNDTFADPRNYTWQAAVPAYAQAITSRYEDILRNGHLLRDSEGNLMVNIDVNDVRVLTTVRKHKDLPRYVIAGTIQPASNIMGNIPDRKKVTIELEGDSLSFWVRKQGSVYIYDKTSPGSPAFYQLDSWHEAGHPWWWSQDMLIEAEVFDKTKSSSLHTESSNTEQGDYSQFTSYVTLDGKERNWLNYDISISEKNKEVRNILILARSSDGDKSKLQVLWDGIEIGKVKKVKNNQWKWHSLKLNSYGKRIMDKCDRESHVLSVVASGSSLDIDKILFEINANREDVSDINPQRIIKIMRSGPKSP